MKKFISIFIAFCFLLAACASQQDNDFVYETTNIISETLDNTTETTTDLICTDNKYNAENNLDEYSKLPSDEYDTILASGDGYYLVKKEEETYNSATTKYGVVDEEGNWTCPLSDKNGFALSADQIMDNGYNARYGNLSFVYMNEGFFIVKVFCALVEEGGIPSGKNIEYSSHCGCFIVRYDGEIITSGEYLMTKYYDGYCFSTNKFGDVTRIDKYGNKTYIANRYYSHQFGLDKLALPSCGLIYCNYAFYNVETGKLAIDLSEYDLGVNSGTYQFKEDGTFTFYFYNQNQTRYVATIDVNGNFVQEPSKC